MCHSKKQRGSMLVITLFVILVLAFLGITMINLLSGTSQSVIYEVLGARAKFAAQSGLQRIATSAFPLNSPVAACNATVSSSAGLPQGDGLENCQYQAACTTTAITKQNQQYNYYRFVSTGVCQAGDIWVSRTLEMDAFEEQ
ncbi:MAG: type II secretory pathway protein [Pseudomonadota bacterium]|jgi:MSHA biogenesis protein MshP|nr:type II secretory pathway protein [Alteromonadaceae bacterium]MCP4234724.1 type II secretory pathway protein [Aestuariibacter sp.]MCP5011717.1 type II secretory pathway protein [Aestuariibacter sp.]MEC8228156.1 type II secretory pathway protein [Pseudomonadota bacterium]|tara:strand:- start:604 stop:1029 length:426 start_codon:yes stop_codon:yes gene_type:complete